MIKFKTTLNTGVTTSPIIISPYPSTINTPVIINGIPRPDWLDKDISYEYPLEELDSSDQRYYKMFKYLFEGIYPIFKNNTPSTQVPVLKLPIVQGLEKDDQSYFKKLEKAFKQYETDIYPVRFGKRCNLIDTAKEQYIKYMQANYKKDFLYTEPSIWAIMRSDFYGGSGYYCIFEVNGRYFNQTYLNPSHANYHQLCIADLFSFAPSGIIFSVYYDLDREVNTENIIHKFLKYMKN